MRRSRPMPEDSGRPAPRTGAERYLSQRLEDDRYRAAFDASRTRLQLLRGGHDADDVGGTR